MKPGLIFYLFLILGAPYVNASPWQRSADQRTLLPEKLERGRNDWGIDLGAGYSQYSGNVEQTSANMEFTYFNKMEHDSFYVNSGVIYGLSKGAVSQNQGRIAMRYDHPVTENFKWFVFNTHAYNEFLKLDYRTTLGAGPWYDFQGEKWRNGVSMAPAFFYEDFDGFGTEKDFWISLRNYYMAELNETTGVGFDVFYMFRANDPDDHLIFFQPFLETEIQPDRFSLKLSYNLEGDSRPKPGVKSTDFNYYATLVMHFGE